MVFPGATHPTSRRWSHGSHMTPNRDHSIELLARESFAEGVPLSDPVPAAGTAEAAEQGLGWAGVGGRTWTTLDVVSGVCVVRVRGDLDSHALQPCRAALDAAFALRPRRIILDLGNTTPPPPVAVVLLAAARRYLQHRGVALTLTALPDALRRALERAHVIALYDVQP